MPSRELAWSLSRKRFYGNLDRARAELTEAVGQPRMTHRQFLEWMRDVLPNLFWGIERAVFHEWTDVMEWRIAVLNTVPRPAIRNGLFETRKQITMATGWYPLVQGCAPISARRLHKGISSKELADLCIGKILEVRCEAGDYNSGTAFRLTGSHGSLALDFGFHGGDWLSDCRAAFLSHFHRDHSGGLANFFRLSNGPLLLSEPTLALLLEAYPWARTTLHDRARIVEGHVTYHIGGGASITVFPVHHCPGSLGITYFDGNSSVTFIGDMCLKNGFLDQRKILLETLNPTFASNPIILVDTAAVGFGSGRASTTTSVAVDSIRESLNLNTVIVMAPDSSSCLHLYLAAYRAFLGKTHRPAILVPPETYAQIKALAAMRRRDKGFPRDAVLSAARGLNNILETQQLYPLTKEVCADLPSESKVLVVTDPYSLGSIPGIEGFVSKARVLSTGRLTQREIPWVEKLSHRVERIDGADWSFHSDLLDLGEFCRTLQEQGCRLGLFHANERLTRTFAATARLNEDKTAFMKTSVSLVVDKH